MNEKKMSLIDLVFMGMGGCIGAGIFSMLGVGIGLTGRSVAVAFLIAMAFKMSQQVRMVIMSSMFSLSGGMYSQQARLLNPLLTGVTAVDDIDGSCDVSVDTSALNLAKEGTYSITYFAMDNSGNIGSCQRKINVK